MKLVLQIAAGIVVGAIGLSVLQQYAADWKRQAYRKQLKQAYRQHSANCENHSLSEEERNRACEHKLKNLNIQLEELNKDLKSQ